MQDVKHLQAEVMRLKAKLPEQSARDLRLLGALLASLALEGSYRKTKHHALAAVQVRPKKK